MTRTGLPSGQPDLPGTVQPDAPPLEPLVERLADALMTPRPSMRITDPVRDYFRARARYTCSPGPATRSPKS